jgi:hypothetical protein
MNKEYYDAMKAAGGERYERFLAKAREKNNERNRKRRELTRGLVFESDYIRAGKGYLLEGYVRL